MARGSSGARQPFRLSASASTAATAPFSRTSPALSTSVGVGRKTFVVGLRIIIIIIIGW